MGYLRYQRVSWIYSINSTSKSFWSPPPSRTWAHRPRTLARICLQPPPKTLNTSLLGILRGTLPKNNRNRTCQRGLWKETVKLIFQPRCFRCELWVSGTLEEKTAGFTKKVWSKQLVSPQEKLKRAHFFPLYMFVPFLSRHLASFFLQEKKKRQRSLSPFAEPSFLRIVSLEFRNILKVLNSFFWVVFGTRKFWPPPQKKKSRLPLTKSAQTWGLPTSVGTR